MKHENLKPVIYIAGRFSDGGTLNEEECWKNRNVMRYFSIRFMKKGWAVICPIENDEWAYEDGIITYKDTIESDLAIINKCDAIFFCPGWEQGKGTKIEHQFATDNNIAILYDVISAENRANRFPGISAYDNVPISDFRETEKDLVKDGG
tara:strand:+ start:245 stop:694 length:450 start_codon:yes stop_codon:yes gene_type:complete